MNTDQQIRAAALQAAATIIAATEKSDTGITATGKSDPKPSLCVIEMANTFYAYIKGSPARPAVKEPVGGPVATAADPAPPGAGASPVSTAPPEAPLTQEELSEKAHYLAQTADCAGTRATVAAVVAEADNVDLMGFQVRLGAAEGPLGDCLLFHWNRLPDDGTPQPTPREPGWSDRPSPSPQAPLAAPSRAAMRADLGLAG